MVGYALTGSFCTHKKSLETAKALINNGVSLIPILSENVKETDTRFGKSKDIIGELEEICKIKCITTIVEAEQFGPAVPLEALVISPCTGNTLAKMALGITDTSVTMTAKAHLRSSRPLLIALATNDGLSANLKNIGEMLQKKNVYFVPMRQDDPKNKPHSLVAEFDLLPAAFKKMMCGKQIRPLFI